MVNSAPSPKDSTNPASAANATKDGPAHLRKILTADPYIWALVALLGGIAGLYLVTGLWHPGHSSGQIEWEETSFEVVRGLLATAVELGALTIVFEKLADNSRKEVVETAIQTLFDQKVPIIADLAAKAVAAEGSFVASMSPDGRTEHLAAFIRGGLKNEAHEAGDLILRAARELSGKTHYRNYKAMFLCVLTDPTQVGTLTLKRTYSTNVRPSRQSYRFITVATHAVKPPASVHDEESFTWTFRLPPGIDHGSMHAKFKLTRVIIDGQRYEIHAKSAPKVEEDGQVWTTEQIIDVDAQDAARLGAVSAAEASTPSLGNLTSEPRETMNIDIEVELEAPLVRNCAYVVYPGSLTHTYSATCIFHDVKGLVPMPIEFLRTARAQIDELPSPENATSISISTDDWIMPSAGGGFVFHNADSS